MKHRIAALLIALTLILCMAALGEEYQPRDDNMMNFGRLLIDLLHAYETPAPGDAQAIEASLRAIQAVDAADFAVAQAIVNHWNVTYLDPARTFRLYLYRGGDRATELEETGLVDSPSHAFVVLGFELKNGRMTSELKGRCDAAAAAARSFPSAILVCSGGATGKNNPERHTEAGLMKRYLVEKCGIDASRIIIDEEAMSTVTNAVNTFKILRERNIQSITLVTSSYHQRWGQVLYNAMSAMYRQTLGYSVDILENYNYEIEAQGTFRHDDRWAIRQLTAMLKLPDNVIEAMKKAF